MYHVEIHLPCAGAELREDGHVAVLDARDPDARSSILFVRVVYAGFFPVVAAYAVNDGRGECFFDPFC